MGSEQGNGEAKILSIACKKGGTTKTTVVLQIAACLAEDGDSVLVVDLDSQHNATNAVGGKESTAIVAVFYPDETPSLENLEASPISLRSAVQETGWKNVSLVPGSKKLVAAESAGTSAAYNLKTALDELRSDFDWILIDTAPSTGLLTTAALLASDRVLIPVELQSEDAVSGMVETYKLARTLQKANSELRVIGILLNRKQPRRNVCEAIEEELRASPLGELVFPVAIREATVLQQARKARIPLVAFDPKAPVLEDFRAAAAHLKEAW